MPAELVSGGLINPPIGSVPDRSATQPIGLFAGCQRVRFNGVYARPHPLPRGRQLVTLMDAARYIQKLPKAEQQIEEWQTAVEALILVAESNGGPTMLARIGVMQALNRNVERVFTSRKDHHWGKRKLARDR